MTFADDACALVIVVAAAGAFASVDAAEAVEDEDGEVEGDMLSGGKTIPVTLAFRPLPPYASSSVDEEVVALGHWLCPEAVPGRDDPPVPTIAYCSRPRPALDDGRLPTEVAPLTFPRRPLEDDGRKPLEY